MNIVERGYLTNAMAHSGIMMNFKKEDVYIVDKHSTGGVGDKTSLILLPLVVECGLN